MTNARLNGLLMTYIHRTRSGQDALKFDSIVDEFAARHPRRMELCDLGARQDSELRGVQFVMSEDGLVTQLIVFFTSDIIISTIVVTTQTSFNSLFFSVSRFLYT